MPTLLSPGHRSSDSSPSNHSDYVAVLLLGLTMALRFAPLPENFSAFGALAIFCGIYASGSVRWWLPLAALFLADCIGHFAGIPGMGFYHLPSMVLNYTGLAAMIVVSVALSRWVKSSSSSRWIGAQAFASMALVAFLASACFFLISNFGAWLDPLMQYPNSPWGLMQCYFAGLPFWRSTLTSDILFTIGFSLFAKAFLPALSRLSFSK